MGVDASDSLTQLPEEMLKFLLDGALASAGPRYGRLLSAGREAIETPHYVAATSRGVVPHIANDVFQRHTSIRAVYVGLEDCT